MLTVLTITTVIVITATVLANLRDELAQREARAIRQATYINTNRVIPSQPIPNNFCNACGRLVRAIRYTKRGCVCHDCAKG